MNVIHGCLLLLCAYTANAQYNCNRLGAVCGGTCNADGSCDPCDAGFSGYDCSVVTANENGGTCVADVTCGLDATCWDDAGTPTCLCSEDKTGADCTTPVFDLTCDVDKMSLTVTPLEADYPGVLSVFGQTDPACMFDPPTATDLLDADCGGVETEGTTKIRKFMFKQTSGIMTDVDFFVITRCGTGDTLVKEVTVTEIDFVPEDDLIILNKGTVPVDADVMFNLYVNDEVLNGSITLSDSLKVAADLTEVGKENFKAIRFEGCVAKPTAEDAGMTLIDEKCPGELEGLMGDLTVDETEISYDLRAFKFDESDIVIIQCSIKVCDIAADCDPDPCAPAARRKKRAADSTEHRVLSQSFRIDDPFTKIEEDLERENERNTCNQSAEMLATVVGLSTALAVVLLICIILIVKIMVKGRKTYPHEK